MYDCIKFLTTTDSDKIERRLYPHPSGGNYTCHLYPASHALHHRRQTAIWRIAVAGEVRKILKEQPKVTQPSTDVSSAASMTESSPSKSAKRVDSIMCNNEVQMEALCIEGQGSEKRSVASKQGSESASTSGDDEDDVESDATDNEDWTTRPKFLGLRPSGVTPTFNPLHGNLHVAEAVDKAIMLNSDGTKRTLAPGYANAKQFLTQRTEEKLNERRFAGRLVNNLNLAMEEALWELQMQQHAKARAERLLREAKDAQDIGVLLKAVTLPWLEVPEEEERTEGPVTDEDEDEDEGMAVDACSGAIVEQAVGRQVMDPNAEEDLFTKFVDIIRGGEGMVKEQ